MSGATTELEIPPTGRIDDPADQPPIETTDPPKPQNPREEAMARIAANYEIRQRASELAHGELLTREASERAAEAEHVEPEEPEPEPAKLGDTQEPEPPVSAAERPHEQTPAVVAQPQTSQAPQLRTVMVQGHPLQVTEDQLARLAEIGAIANLAMQQQAQQPAPQPHQAPQQHQPPQPALDRERAAQIVQRLSYGTPDDGAAALQELASALAPQQPQQIDLNQLRHAAATDAYQRIRLENDLQTIGTEFPDIFSNQTRAYTAAIHLTEIRQRDAVLGQVRPPIEQYREAANMVRDAFTSPQLQPGSDAHSPALQAAIQVRDTQPRLERKRAAPRNPAAVSRAASLGAEAPRPPTNSELVDQIRRSRGQLPYN